MTSKLDGRTAIVTGAGSGIGRGIARLFAAEGAAVACLDQRKPQAEAAAAEIEKAGGRAIAVQADVSDGRRVETVVQSIAERLERLDILVNAAAHFIADASVVTLDEDDWERSFAVNVGGCFLMSKHAVPHMVAAGGGSIIHVSSQMALVGRPGQSAYCATKSALCGLTKAMALDHAAERIRVNTLSPGGVATESMIEKWGSREKAEKEWGAPMHPLGRLAHVEEIARAALFLASDDSSFMTGADLLVDGGYTAR